MRPDRAEDGLDISLKQWATLPHIIDESGMHAAAKTLLVEGRARACDILPVYHGSNMRLYNDVLFIGLPPSYTTDIGDGPFNVAHYTDNVRGYSQRAGIDKTGMYLCLRDGNTFGSADLPTSTDLVCMLLPAERFRSMRWPFLRGARNCGFRGCGDNGRLARNIDIYGDGRIPHSLQNLCTVLIPAGAHRAF